MKSITFQLGDNGKVIVFPNDPSGKGLDPKIQFNRSELELVQSALFNIQHHPHLYDVAATDFESGEKINKVLDLTEFAKKYADKDVSEVLDPNDED